MTITDQNIPTDPKELHQFATQLLTGFTELEDKHASFEARHKAEIQNRDMMIEKLRHQLFGLRKDKFGSSEFDHRQAQFFFIIFGSQLIPEATAG